MGKRPADIEQEIKAKRQAVSQKVDDMTQRGADDVREAGDRVHELFDSSPINKSLESQPLLTLAAALGAGVMLGMASESISLPNLGSGAAGRSRQGSAGGGGESGLLTGLIAGLETAAIEEGRQLIHEWMSPTRSGSRSDHGNGHTGGGSRASEYDL